uniref:Uncharacterized protein n=1 Tax=Branchiostoma floridae TaxID=7739 RepID=C3ZLY4_BRAFL|eukprot:XP_002590454.1 hypothetical protein BRAFLDRAFT_86331 [Branchiostoma floridae]
MRRRFLDVFPCLVMKHWLRRRSTPMAGPCLLCRVQTFQTIPGEATRGYASASSHCCNIQKAHQLSNSSCRFVAPRGKRRIHAVVSKPQLFTQKTSQQGLTSMPPTLMRILLTSTPARVSRGDVSMRPQSCVEMKLNMIMEEQGDDNVFLEETLPSPQRIFNDSEVCQWKLQRKFLMRRPTFH